MRVLSMIFILALTFSCTKDDIDSINENPDIPGTTVRVPDRNFREALRKNGIPVDEETESIFKADAEPVTELYLQNSRISSLDGIEAFRNLEILDISRNNLTQLGLSFMLKLRELYASDNDLVQFNTSTLLELNIIDINNNKLVFMDLSRNSKLEKIFLTNNEMQVVTIQNGRNTRLKDLDVRLNQKLYYIVIDDLNYIGDNWKKDEQAKFFPTYNIEGYTYVSDENFRHLLEYEYGFTMVRLLEKDRPEYLIDVEVEKILRLRITDRQIKDLRGIEVFKNLISLDASNNDIKYANIAGNPNLKEVYLNNNNMTELVVGDGFNIETLVASHNKLTTINLQKVTGLKELDLSYNNLQEVNTQNSFRLKKVDLSHNKIKYTSFENNNQLEDINISYNQNAIAYLNFQEYTKIKHLNVKNNPPLNCIKVLDPAHFEEKFKDSKDSFAVYNQEC